MPRGCDPSGRPGPVNETNRHVPTNGDVAPACGDAAGWTLLAVAPQTRTNAAITQAARIRTSLVARKHTPGSRRRWCQLSRQLDPLADVRSIRRGDASSEWR